MATLYYHPAKQLVMVSNVIAKLNDVANVITDKTYVTSELKATIGAGIVRLPIGHHLVVDADLMTREQVTEAENLGFIRFE